MKGHKNIDWNIVDIQENINDAVEDWNKLFTDVANRHAPIRKLRIKGRYALWITVKLSNAMRDRDYHRRKAVKSNSEYHWKLSGLPDHCIFEAKSSTMLFVFLCTCFCFLCLLDYTNDDLASKMQ